MEDEPYVIRLNIRHYEAMLQLPGTDERRRHLSKLLAEAKAQLALAEAEETKRARARQVPGRSPERRGRVDGGGMAAEDSGADRWVIKRNIARFRAMLQVDITADRRLEIERLLAEEQRKLAAIDRKNRRR